MLRYWHWLKGAFSSAQNSDSAPQTHDDGDFAPVECRCAPATSDVLGISSVLMPETFMPAAEISISSAVRVRRPKASAEDAPLNCAPGGGLPSNMQFARGRPTYQSRTKHLRVVVKVSHMAQPPLACMAKVTFLLSLSLSLSITCF